MILPTILMLLLISGLLLVAYFMHQKKQDEKRGINLNKASTPQGYKRPIDAYISPIIPKKAKPRMNHSQRFSEILRMKRVIDFHNKEIKKRILAQG